MTARRDGSPLVSVLVPTLDEERELPRAARPPRRAARALGGRSSPTAARATRRVALARAHPRAPRVVEQRGGRAAQLNAAARAATGDVLLFLHADSRLPRDAYASLAEAWRAPGVAGGNFALRFDGGGAFERVLGAVYRLQRRHGFYYGDSSVWVRREAFDALGGYREIPIMDDYDFVRRLERRGAHALPARPGDDVRAALARDRHPAHGARVVRHPLAVRRRRAPAAARPAVPGRALASERVAGWWS